MASITLESLPPVVQFLVRVVEPYRPHRRWGDFDSLHIRAIDDLFFLPEESELTLYGFTAEPPHHANVECIALPLQLALERFYFHTSKPTRLVLNPRGVLHGASLPQRGLEFSMPDDFEAEIAILRDEVPALLGEISSQAQAKKELLFGAEKALAKGSFFECFYLAHQARTKNPTNPKAWFYELYAFSFFGEPDDALALYEEYPERGSSDPFAQLLAGRYRLLLKQLNEARTILHTVSFHEDVGALASCEMARSYLLEKYFTRAIDTASAAISKDSSITENFLIRGIAQRGVSYDAGDREGLNEAYKDFEVVAKRGGYAAAEALYHAGTVCARLGALPQAEQLFRQSLFQRDRISPRDGLIRVLCALDKKEEAKEELSLFEKLAPQQAQQVRSDIGAALEAPNHSKLTQSGTKQSTGLWQSSRDAAIAEARALLAAWSVPISNSVTDCALLDDLFNRFAPDGDFPIAGRFSVLSEAGHDTVSRACALHIGALLVAQGVGEWGPETEHGLTLVSTREQVRIPIENFVKERILLGASGDNFSSLESLVVELQAGVGQAERYREQDWWSPARETQLQEYAQQVAWVRERLTTTGVPLTGTLTDFETLDNWIDTAFEPGGAMTDDVRGVIGGELERFIAGVGFLVGETIARNVRCVWGEHEKTDGIWLWNAEIGRLFPIARMHRRIFLASAADFSTKLSGLAWSVAVASVTERIRSGDLVGQEAVRSALQECLPSIQSFPEAELSGVIDSLLIGASLRAE